MLYEHLPYSQDSDNLKCGTLHRWEWKLASPGTRHWTNSMTAFSGWALPWPMRLMSLSHPACPDCVIHLWTCNWLWAKGCLWFQGRPSDTSLHSAGPFLFPTCPWTLNTLGWEHLSISTWTAFDKQQNEWVNSQHYRDEALPFFPASCQRTVLFFFEGQGIWVRASHSLGKCSTTELNYALSPLF